MYEIQQPQERVLYVGQRKQRPMSKIIMILAIIYWLSPIDAMPLMPPDDILVMVMALWYSGMFGGGDE